MTMLGIVGCHPRAVVIRRSVQAPTALRRYPTDMALHWPKPLLMVVALGLCTSSCRRAQTLPPPPPHAYGTLPNDPLRDRLREILTPCGETLTELKNARMSASRKDIALAVLELLTLNLATQMSRGTSGTARGEMNAQAAMGRGADPSLCSGPARTSNPQCRLNGIPFDGPIPAGIRDGLDDTVSLPEARINAALDQIDDVLWQGHTYESLTDEQFAEWNRLTNELETSCHRLERILHN